MTAPLMFVLAQLRGRWRGWLALSLLVGLFAGTVVAVAAGAQRTGSAYPRLLAWSNAPDAMVLSPSASPGPSRRPGRGRSPGSRRSRARPSPRPIAWPTQRR